MKKSELHQIIKEEISKILDKNIFESKKLQIQKEMSEHVKRGGEKLKNIQNLMRKKGYKI